MPTGWPPKTPPDIITGAGRATLAPAISRRKGSMSKKLHPYDRLDLEAERIAQKVSSVLRSYRLSGDGFAEDIPDVFTLWQEIGRRLVEHECDECGPSGWIEIIAIAALRAINQGYDDRGPQDNAAAQERCESIQTLIRLATIDGKPVAP
jgi:hypothetical protein